jgi:hypothetical protein
MSEAPQEQGLGEPREEERGRPDEAEVRRRIEEQLRKVRVQDLLLESVVSVLSLSARRIAKEDERDLDQARVGIEAVRAVIGLLDAEPAKQVRASLSEIQMLYAKQAAGPGEREGSGEGPSEGGPGSPGGGEGRGPSRLWTPPGA